MQPRVRCQIPAPARLEVLEQMEPWVEAHVLPLLKPAEEAWQPADLVPDAAALGADGFHAACVELRGRAAGVPDAHLVCLVGNMVTEEALPTYQSMANRFESARDVTGADATAWARWIRGWSAEENRHGDVLNRYMYLSGRLDMRQVERTVHRLIGSGMAMHAPASPYHGFIYVAFQERATAISHGNTARNVRAHGDDALARICGAIASDEKRHEAAYTRVVERLLEADPDTTVRALAYMMRRRITMPAALMDDGRDADLFAHYAAAAQQAPNQAAGGAKNSSPASSGPRRCQPRPASRAAWASSWPSVVVGVGARLKMASSTAAGPAAPAPPRRPGAPAAGRRP